MKPHLWIKRLKLKGISKDYDYSFNHGLNIIAGPMSTGKTSVLEFIDYCFGAKDHPTHPEIRRRVTAVLLEIEINHQQITIIRNLFSDSNKCIIHECSIDELNSLHSLYEIQAYQLLPEKESISTYILKKLGLFGISLKESPTQNSSGKDAMSFRNMMWFCFLPNKRLDNDNLLLEDQNFMKRIKFQQVFDVIFEIHSGTNVNLAYQIKTLKDDLSQSNKEIYILQNFLKANKTPSQADINKQIKNLENECSDARRNLNNINSKLRSESDIVKNMREKIKILELENGELSSIRRDRETLLERLAPLKGQYSEDIKKLNFLKEAKTILNPVGLSRCPFCLSELEEYNDQTKCQLCGNELKLSQSESFNIDKEIKITGKKLKDLDKYILENNNELLGTLERLKENNDKLKLLKQNLDTAIEEYISPYIAERDEYLKEINNAELQIQHSLDQLDFHISIQRKIDDKNQLEELLNEKTLEIADSDITTESRKNIISDISAQFGKILEESHYPKLENPFIDNQLKPHVRYSLYKEIGTSGGKTLVSLSWLLSIFEIAINNDKSHPGFIMIDTPQKNLGTNVQKDDSLFGDKKIVEGFYNHIIEYSVKNKTEIQLIIADNTPPEIAKDFITIQFSGNPEKPPYGLIDDEY